MLVVIYKQRAWRSACDVHLQSPLLAESKQKQEIILK